MGENRMNETTGDIAQTIYQAIKESITNVAKIECSRLAHSILDEMARNSAQVVLLTLQTFEADGPRCPLCDACNICGRMDNHVH